ncbi:MULTISPECIES: helix-turn-helix domain-containing protein [unclassified Vibrio]|uniref:helix-turn-helix domain-containing protein n=1 Tax=unclassified Vibrio TaxID=2614977 RepID=UPI003550B540
MSEDKTLYGKFEQSMTLVDLIESKCALPLSSPDYVSPTPEQIKWLRTYLGLSQAKLGYFLGKTVTPKGCSIVRKWETASDKKEHREIDANAWRRMLYAAGLANPSDDVKQVL